VSFDFERFFRQLQLIAHSEPLRWSPDGTYIVAPNSMNGPVFVAGVIKRRDFQTGEGWDLASSLIGHPDIVQVAVSENLSKPTSLLRD